MRLLQSCLAASVVLFGVGGQAALLVGPDYFSSITDGDSSYVYRTYSGHHYADSTNLIDGVYTDEVITGLVGFGIGQSIPSGMPLTFTINMELSEASSGFTLNTFHIWNDYGPAVSDGVDSFTVEFYPLPGASGQLLSTLSVPDIAGPDYDKTRQDYPLESTISGVQSLVFTIIDFAGPGNPPNGGHIREIGVSVPEPSAFLCLGLIGVGLIAWKKLTGQKN